MTRAGKSAALILLVVFFAQPLVAATSCWLMTGATAHCDDPCPMPGKPKPSPVKAKSTAAARRGRSAALKAGIAVTTRTAASLHQGLASAAPLAREIIL